MVVVVSSTEMVAVAINEGAINVVAATVVRMDVSNMSTRRFGKFRMVAQDTMAMLAMLYSIGPTVIVFPRWHG